jgi:N-acetylglucosaminyl-diphospho-decaprenol L-rhamnosyltransferase
MVLSVIIVNYRVRYFLELCLYSVSRALADIEAEIIVVDNHSGDGSVEALKPLFPAVQFIVNQVNTGFATANNQAFRQAGGEYILFLNPDTLLPEDYVRVCLGFLRDRPNAGGLGVRMIDGGGQFLKESRRGFPSPWVAFCKMSGLSALLPRSRLFAGYYLGHLPEDSSHPAPVLSGACLLVRHKVLDTVGVFDERFFMYAEDIDLSYRMEKAGYQNYYTSGTTVIHFKGESTRKDSRYIRQFYKAMSQFRRKHFNRGLPGVFNGSMEAAIWIRAGIAGLARAISGLFRRGPRSRAGAVEAATPAVSWLAGDPGETARVKERLIASGKRVLAASPETAKELLFCQGNDFSFRDCIEGLEAATPGRHGQQAKFVAAGSNSATGSTDRDGRGETLVF